MKTSLTIKGLMLRLGGLVVALAVVTILINLHWFDEPLHPDLVAIGTPHPVSMDSNAYPLLMGFAAASDTDPVAAGRAIVAELRERYGRGERMEISQTTFDATLAGTPEDAAWRSAYPGLNCNVRTDLNCADRLIDDLRARPARDPRLRALLDRYVTALDLPTFEENQEADAYSPLPNYGLFMAVGRVRLADVYLHEPPAELITTTGRDIAFWKLVLRDGKSLVARMVALAGIRNDIEYLSKLMRERELGPVEIADVREAIAPLTPDERDLGPAFTSEMRFLLLSAKPLVVILGEPSIFARLTLQENATLNEVYLSLYAPATLRARLPADEFYRQRTLTPLGYRVRAFPPPLYNLGGKLAIRRAPAMQDYISRVHDLSGRMALVELQADIEQAPTRDVAAVVRSSSHRNPYTGEPMIYDAATRTLRFDCLSNPNDVCGIALGAQ